MSPVFEWDNRKAKSNFRKHRVHFTAAASVFSDPLARIFPDEAHSENEVREIINRALNREAPLVLLVYFAEPTTALAARRRQNKAIMKNISQPRTRTKKVNGLRAEYRFDYTKPKPNRFAARIAPGPFR